MYVIHHVLPYFLADNMARAQLAYIIKKNTAKSSRSRAESNRVSMEKITVKLYVYDISRGFAKQLSPLLLGKSCSS